MANAKFLIVASLVVLLLCSAVSGVRKRKNKNDNNGGTKNDGKHGATTPTAAAGAGTSPKGGNNAKVNAKANPNANHSNANANNAAAHPTDKAKSPALATAHPSPTNGTKGKNGGKDKQKVDPAKVAAGLAKLSKPKAALKGIERARMVGGKRVPNARKSGQTKAAAQPAAAAVHAIKQHANSVGNGTPAGHNKPAVIAAAQPANKLHATPAAVAHNPSSPKAAHQPGAGMQQHQQQTVTRHENVPSMVPPKTLKDRNVVFHKPKGRSLSAPNRDIHQHNHLKHAAALQRAHSHNGVISNRRFASSIPSHQTNLMNKAQETEGSRKHAERANSPAALPPSHSFSPSSTAYPQEENVDNWHFDNHHHRQQWENEHQPIEQHMRAASASYEAGNGEPANHETSMEYGGETVAEPSLHQHLPMEEEMSEWKMPSENAAEEAFDVPAESGMSREVFHNEMGEHYQRSISPIGDAFDEQEMMPSKVFDESTEAMSEEAFEMPSDPMPGHVFDDAVSDEHVPSHVFEAPTEMMEMPPSEVHDDAVNAEQISAEHEPQEQESELSDSANHHHHHQRNIPLATNSPKLLASLCQGRTPKLVCTMNGQEFEYFRYLSAEAQTHIGGTTAHCTHLAVENGTLEITKANSANEDDDDEEAGDNDGMHKEQVQFRTKSLGNAVLKLRNDANNLLLSTVNFAAISRTEAFNKQMRQAGQHVLFNPRGTKKMPHPRKEVPSRLDLIKSILEQSKASTFDGFMLDFSGTDLGHPFFADFIMDFALKLHSEKANKIQKTSTGGGGVQRRVFAIRLDGIALASLTSKSGTLVDEFVKKLNYADMIVFRESGNGHGTFDVTKWLLQKGVNCEKIVGELPANNHCDNDNNNNRRKRAILKELNEAGEEKETYSSGVPSSMDIVGYRPAAKSPSNAAMFDNDDYGYGKTFAVKEKNREGGRIPAAGAVNNNNGPAALMWHNNYHSAKGELPAAAGNPRDLVMPSAAVKVAGNHNSQYTIPRSLLMPTNAKEEEDNGKNAAARQSGGVGLLKWDENWHADNEAGTNTTQENEAVVDHDKTDIVIDYAVTNVAGVAMPLFVREPERQCRAEANPNIVVAHEKIQEADGNATRF